MAACRYPPPGSRSNGAIRAALSLSLGYRPKLDHEDEVFFEIYRKVIAESTKRGLFVGIHTASPA